MNVFMRDAIAFEIYRSQISLIVRYIT